MTRTSVDTPKRWSRWMMCVLHELRELYMMRRFHESHNLQHVKTCELWSSKCRVLSLEVSKVSQLPSKIFGSNDQNLLRWKVPLSCRGCMSFAGASSMHIAHLHLPILLCSDKLPQVWWWLKGSFEVSVLDSLRQQPSKPLAVIYFFGFTKSLDRSGYHCYEEVVFNSTIAVDTCVKHFRHWCIVDGIDFHTTLSSWHLCSNRISKL